MPRKARPEVTDVLLQTMQEMLRKTSGYKFIVSSDVILILRGLDLLLSTFKYLPH